MPDLTVEVDVTSMSTLQRHDEHRRLPLRLRQETAQTPSFDFADDSRSASPCAAKTYNDAIQRGKRHPHAVRILARAWIRII
jgi:hypothetical protein